MCNVGRISVARDIRGLFEDVAVFVADVSIEVARVAVAIEVCPPRIHNEPQIDRE